MAVLTRKPPKRFIGMENKGARAGAVSMLGAKDEIVRPTDIPV